jgi:hypothetical protein
LEKLVWKYTVISVISVISAALLVACGDSNGDGGGGGGDGGGSGGDGGSGGGDAIAQEFGFEDGNWYLFVEMADTDAAFDSRSYYYDEEGQRSAMGTAGASNSLRHALQIGENHPTVATEIWLEAGPGPATFMLYFGQERVDEATVSGVGERVVLTGGQIVARHETATASVSGEPGHWEFVAVVAGMGRTLSLEGSSGHNIIDQGGEMRHTLSLGPDNAEVNEVAHEANGHLEVRWVDDLEPGTYLNDQDGLGLQLWLNNYVYWNFGATTLIRESIEYFDCDISLEVTTVCDDTQVCAGELTLNCRADYLDTHQSPVILETGHVQAVYRFDTSAG